MKEKLPERRRFIRLEVPLKVVVKNDNQAYDVITKNISPIGLRFEIGIELMDRQDLEMDLFIPDLDAPILIKGIVVWHKKMSLEDDAPYDVGVEITKVEEEKKNDFLKYLCDLMYNLKPKIRM